MKQVTITVTQKITDEFSESEDYRELKNKIESGELQRDLLNTDGIEGVTATFKVSDL